MTASMPDEVKLLPCPLTRLAEHLSARPLSAGQDDFDVIGRWLDYSLNRCGLVVVEEQSLTRAIEATRPTDMEIRDAE